MPLHKEVTSCQDLPIPCQHIYKCTYVYAYIYTYDIYICIHTHIYIHSYVYICTHTYVYTHVNIYTCECPCSKRSRESSSQLMTIEVEAVALLWECWECIASVGSALRVSFNLKQLMTIHLQPITLRVSFNFHLHFQSPWSLCNGTWQKRRRELEQFLRLENEKLTL